MQVKDPASLSNLNDIVLPAKISWWPLAPGWYVLIALLSLALLWWLWQAWQNWKHNRYRRQSLQELAQIQSELKNNNTAATAILKIPALLKRTALAAYPREQIAGLSTQDWFKFLNRTTPTPLFSQQAIDALQTLAYASKDRAAIANIAIAPTLASVSAWIRQHQLPISKHQQGGH